MIEHLLAEASDSDLSLQLSDASSLSSDSEHMGSGRGKASSNKAKRQRIHAKNGRKQTRPKPKEGKQKTAKSVQGAKHQVPKARRQSLGKTSKGENTQYCVCRKGYDGKEFMVACDTCQEWFHGRCVGVSPKSVTEHFFCGACALKKHAEASQPPTPKPTASKGRGGKKGTKAKKQAPPRKKNTKVPEEPPKPEPEPIIVSGAVGDDEDEDLDDICPVCDSECTCGTSTSSTAKIAEPDVTPISTTLLPDSTPKEAEKVVQRKGESNSQKPKKKKRPAGKGKRGSLQANEELDEDLVVDDEGAQNVAQANGSHPGPSWDHEDDQDVDPMDEELSHFESGDEDEVDEEDRAIMEEIIAHEDDSSDMNNDDFESDGEEYEEHEFYILEDSAGEDDEPEDLEAYYGRISGRWTSSEEEDDDEEDEDSVPYAHGTHIVEVTGESDTDPGAYQDPMLSLVDENGNLFDDIAAAFLQVLEPLAGMSAAGNEDLTAGTAHDILRGDFSLDFSAKHDTLDSMLRRPSLPSSTVAAADQQHQAMADFTSESLSALSLLAADTTLPIPVNQAPKEANAKLIADLLGAMESSSANKLPSSAALEPLAPQPAIPPALRPDLKLQEQLLELFKISSTSSLSSTASLPKEPTPSSSSSTTLPLSPTTQHSPTPSSASTYKKNTTPTTAATAAITPTPQYGNAPNSRQILPKPAVDMTASDLQTMLANAGFSLADPTLASLPSGQEMAKGKKRRRSEENDTLNDAPASTGVSPPLTAASSSSQAESEPTLVSMEELVDTSQLYTRSSSRSPSPGAEETDAQLSRDLTRWQRVPIGAFRLLRSKNRLWLER